MKFNYDTTFCHDLNLSLKREWLETNGTGDYASSTITGCNTRKYHGLLVSGDGYPENRAVLLSSMEESVFGQGEFFFSMHAYPGAYHPKGYEYLHSVTINYCPTFEYLFSCGAKLTKEVMMLQGQTAVMLRYTLEHDKALTLDLRPMTAFRHYHTLAHDKTLINAEVERLLTGIRVDFYYDMPFLYMEVEGNKHEFYYKPNWYYNVEYPVERERGFDFKEDLFQPGIFHITLSPGESIYFIAATSPFSEMYPEETMADVWNKEYRRRKRAATKSVESHLAEEGRRFILELPSNFTGIDAGYHWFAIWGRDMFIALPWLTFYAGREKAGVTILKDVALEMKNGLVPNMFSSHGHAYNSVDASLWYIAAIQQMLLYSDKYLSVIKKELRAVIKSIISAYAGGNVPFVNIDKEGFLSVGTENTQLTWMDASVNGRPATPRHGCPVEIAALWYNALAFDQELAERLGDERSVKIDLEKMRKTFNDRFWLEKEGYVADVWRSDSIDNKLRPNQLFAIALPYAALEEKYHKSAVMEVKKHLLTPYGLRTLAPGSEGYQSHYGGSPEQRDSSYHQGTVWPWLLGVYAEALLKATMNSKTEIKSLLKTLSPLYSTHLKDAGVGTISEIFDAEEPYKPDGTIAQAWSVSECYRLLMLMKQAAPEIYEEWEAQIRQGGN